MTSQAFGTAMRKIESAVIDVVLGIAFPFIVASLVSGKGIFFLPDILHLCRERCLHCWTVSGNVITLPEILVSTANLVVTLLVEILIICGVWGLLEYVVAGGGEGRGGVWGPRNEWATRVMRISYPTA